ncbi:MAG: hypothetical protein M3Y44_14015 [Actinomycetota bacterium]|nr:hypothetical protein [Actinomycetota bacterium]
MHPAYEDDALRGLTAADRTDLSRRLRAIEGELDAGLGGGHQARELFITITACASLILVPWIAFLPAVLPATHAVSHWRQVWVGFDITLAIMLACTAWLAIRRRQIVVLVAFVTGTLLLCDAWFDLMTAASGWDRVLSIGSSVLEVSLAGILFNTARLFFHYTAHCSGSPDAGRIAELPGRSRGALTGLPSGLESLSLLRVVKQHRTSP